MRKKCKKMLLICCSLTFLFSCAGKPTAAVSAYHPLVVDGVLIGGYHDGEWAAATDFAGELTGGEMYRLYRMDGYLGESKGSAVAPLTDDWSGPYFEQVELEYAASHEAESFLVPSDQYPDDTYFALNCDWDAMPRTPAAQSLKHPFYQQVVTDVLAENGLKNAKAELLQNYRIDLDGDGTEEVLLYAENQITDGWQNRWRYERFANNAGCFSVLILRKIIDGNVQNLLLDLDIHTAEDAEMDTKIRYLFPAIGFADLNGDNRMEIITSFRYYEGLGCDVYELAGEEFRLVMGNGVFV